MNGFIRIDMSQIRRPYSNQIFYKFFWMDFQIQNLIPNLRHILAADSQDYLNGEKVYRFMVCLASMLSVA